MGGNRVVAVVTADPDLAIKLGEVIESPKVYIVNLPWDSADKEAAAREMRHKIHQAQPEVVVLDVRMGKNVFRAVESVPGILDTRSGPAVILMLPWRSQRVRDEAARLRLSRWRRR